MSHNHTRFRNDDGPWSVCPSTCPESTSMLGELRRLREVVRRVEGLADERTPEGCWVIRAKLRAALNASTPAEPSTDTGPAPAGAYSGVQGAGDGV